MSLKTKKATRPNGKRSSLSKSSEVIGRPSLYRPEYCAQLLEWSKQPFGTFEGFAGKIGVDRDTLYEWAKVHPAFSDAKKKSKAINLAAMLEIGQKGVQGHLPKSAWQTAWMFQMKCKHAYREDAAFEEDEAEMGFNLSQSRAAESEEPEAE